MSPFVSSRSTRIHGSSVPSSRTVAGAHEDHHHSGSNLDLASLDADDSAINTSGSSNSGGYSSRARTSGGLGMLHARKMSESGSEPGSPFTSLGLGLGAMGKKSVVVDEFDIDSTKAETPGRFSFDKQLQHDPHSDDSSDEGGAVASPSEVSGASSPAPAAQMERGARKEGRLLIVANRLPVSMKIAKKPADANGRSANEITFSSSSGGLVSALGGCEMESRWIGWPGAEVKRAADRESVRYKLRAQNCVPVFIPQKVCDPFYNGFCNNVLWPLFHYIPLPVESITTADAEFEAYQAANYLFAEVVIREYQEGDVVWIHDYHLMLLPRILRQHYPNIKIGFFFHTPFPAHEIYRGLPSREPLLAGVLASDLIGFHTPDYQHHFANSCQRILGAQSDGALKLTYDRFTSTLGSFPIGIDPKRFTNAIDSDKVKAYYEQYKKEFAGKKVLLGIDRLDYIKGIQHKIFALERLFEKYPNMAREVVLVQIAVPSRTEVVEYQKLRASTHKLVGRVNGKYGSFGSSPISYLDKSIPFDQMCALYRAADAMVITSIRDGMNLVAYEYIACQRDMGGVLLLSEFAGAAQSLGQDDALLVNPWSISSVSEAMRTALTMPEVQRRDRCARMFQHVVTHSSSAWARSYLSSLLAAAHLPLTWLKDLGSESSPNAAEESPDFSTPVANMTKTAPPAPVAPLARKMAQASIAAK